jgi:NAD(P)-dependent dehydrogenase (short-subunit alcohol dehydrogenase family)
MYPFFSGGNRGIGYATVAAFWKLRDYHTIIACRNPKLGEEAAQAIRALDGGGLIEVMRFESNERKFDSSRQR